MLSPPGWRRKIDAALSPSGRRREALSPLARRRCRQLGRRCEAPIVLTLFCPMRRPGGPWHFESLWRRMATPVARTRGQNLSELLLAVARAEYRRRAVTGRGSSTGRRLDHRIWSRPPGSMSKISSSVVGQAESSQPPRTLQAVSQLEPAPPRTQVTHGTRPGRERYVRVVRRAPIRMPMVPGCGLRKLRVSALAQKCLSRNGYGTARSI